MLGQLRLSVAVESYAAASQAITHLAAELDRVGQARIRVEIGGGRVTLVLRPTAGEPLTAADIEVALDLSRRLTDLGLTPTGTPPVQVLEIAIDALDIAAVRAFWRAALDYRDSDSRNRLEDPRGQGPDVWFQQLEHPREQRNRIHLDVNVPHDVAEIRVAAALAAGGRLVSDDHAPAWWVLADPEGNEACISCWLGRD